MAGRRLPVCVLLFLIFREASGLKIQNKLLGKCLQVQDGTLGGRVSLGDCSPHASTQEWRWLPENQALSSQHTGECLSAPGGQYEGVYLKPCIFRAQTDETGGGLAALDLDREANSQAWSCSKKGHLTLIENGLHLSATQESTLVFLSREHKQGSRWRALDSQTLCHGRDIKHHQDQVESHLRKAPEPVVSHTAVSAVDEQAQHLEGVTNAGVTETDPVNEVSLSALSTKSPADPTMIFFSMDYGMAWKVTMLVLSSLALVLGTVILVLNVYANRRKKVVCVLKSYTPRQEVSIPGSPMPSERAPLTEHAMRLPHSSPTLQRGEILIEWKDGTVTPLYEA